MILSGLLFLLLLNTGKSFRKSNYFKHFSLSTSSIRSESQPAEGPINDKQYISKNLKGIGALIATLGFAQSSKALTYPVSDSYYQKAPISLQSDDFWYPPFMIGMWNTSMKFAGASFTKVVPMQQLAASGIPGFDPYSVIFVSDMGKDVENITIKYVEIDSHPREDHSSNIRNLVSAFIPTAVVDDASYYYQKAPDWFHSPANHWKIKYHDDIADGVVELLTRKRSINVFAGRVETIEFIQQKHSRIAKSTGKVSKTIGDYAMNWKLSVPASLNDRFVTVDDLRKSDTLLGTLDILVYPQTTSDLYLRIPAKPAGVFSYNITMSRFGGQPKGYPFVWRDDGPVELDKYFGY